jgi:hypothetical protein
MKKKCSIENCSKVVRCKNLCNSHYSKKIRKKETLIRYLSSESFKNSQRKQRRKSSSKYATAIRGAKRRALDWDITLHEYLYIISKPCYYCGGALPLTGSGLDRMDNTQGYVPNNVVSCCTVCNRIKGPNFSVEETKVMVEALLLYKRNLISKTS